MRGANAHSLLAAAVVGAFVGLIMSAGSLFPEFFHRLRWSWSGGGGETADWGEPLFYIVIMGVPAAALGAAVAAALIGLTLWIVRK